MERDLLDVSLVVDCTSTRSHQFFSHNTMKEKEFLHAELFNLWN
jgi:hypothetical protein